MLILKIIVKIKISNPLFSVKRIRLIGEETIVYLFIFIG